MRYGVLGGDMRFAHLSRMLNESGREAVGILQEKAGGGTIPLSELKRCSCIITNWPMRWPFSGVETSEERIMDYIAPGSTMLLCGPKFPRERRWDLQYVNLWEDEELLCENAYLTAQGAVAVAMRHTQHALAEKQAMVVGYGRIGRALTDILLNLGSKVTVISSRESKRKQAQENGADAAPLLDLADVLPGKQIIFSTPPAIVMDRPVLECVDEDALLIDLASPPYGIDLDAARELNLHAWREPGLPGRYCPMSAARALYNAVRRWEEREHE